MRRGLISRSPVELPDATLEARLDRVRAAMRGAQLDFLLVYTNNTRPAGVSWLTGFVPYWSEALLVVPRHGMPHLAAALSFRVKSWIERVSRLGEIWHHPRIGLKAAQQIAALQTNPAVGIVDFETLPAGIAEDLREGGTGLRLSEAGPLFAGVRAKADPAEIALAAKAAAIGHRALGRTVGTDLNAMIGAVEREARVLGAEEIYVAAAPDLARDARFRRIEGEVGRGESFALRATVAYKGVWVRLVRSFCAGDLAGEAAVRFAQAAARLPSDEGFADGFELWLVEGCRTTQPLDALMGSRLPAAAGASPGAIVSVQGTLTIEDREIPVGAPVLIGQPGETAGLLVNPLFD